LDGRPGYKKYEKYIVKQVKPMVRKLGWKDTGSHLEKYLRASILRTSVDHGDEESIAEAKKIFNDWMYNQKRIAPNLRSTIYLAGVKKGSKKQWDYMWALHQKSNVPTEQKKLMFSLADTEDPELIDRYMSWTMNDTVIRSQDSISLISHLSGNRKAANKAYVFVKKNWDKIYERYGSGSFEMTGIIKSVFGRFKTKEKLEEVKQFFKTHKSGTGGRAVKQVLSGIKNHIDWLEKHEEEVEQWLDQQLKA